MYDSIPKIYYPISVGEKEIEKILSDISINIKLQEDLVNGISYYDYYTIEDGETPESIADKYYGKTKYHYLVMLANSRYDWRNDWPLTQDELNDYIEETYTKRDAIHHYYDTDTGEIVSVEKVSAFTPYKGYFNGDDFYYDKERKYLIPSERNKMYVDLSNYKRYYFNGFNYIETTDDIPSVPAHLIPITNYEYEYELNEGKRNIRLVKKDLADNLDSILRSMASNE